MGDIYLGFFEKTKNQRKDLTLMVWCRDLTIKLRQNGFNFNQVYFVHNQKPADSATCHLMYLDKPVATINKDSKGKISIDRCFDTEKWPGEKENSLGLKAVASDLYAATIRYFDHHYKTDHRRSLERRINYE